MRLVHVFAAGVLALATIPAIAGDHTVIARNGPGGRHFDPATLTVAVGDTVTFINDPADPGFHNVKSDDGALTEFRCAAGCDGDGAGGNGNPASSLWSATVTFPTAGTIGYYCEIHGGTGGQGMAGSIVVTGGAGAPTIGVTPDMISATAEVGATATSAFAIANSGTAALDWTADTASASCDTPDNVPWIVLDPTSGSIAVGAAAAAVDVTLDATSLDEGVYSANICIHSNDAANDPVQLPVQFTVTTLDLIFQDGFDG